MRRLALVGLLVLACCAQEAPPRALDAEPRRASRLVGDERRPAISPRRATDSVRVAVPPGAVSAAVRIASWRSGWQARLGASGARCFARALPSGTTTMGDVDVAASETTARWVALEMSVEGVSELEFGCEGLQADAELWFAPSFWSPAPPTARNLLLVSLDTVRLDALGRSNPPATPVLDGLARTSTSFTRAFATAPWTLPSHVSVMTGLHPSWHGRWDARTRDHELPEITTLASRLAALGWETAAFTGQGSISWTLGTTRDFSLVVEHEPTRRVARRECDVSSARVEDWLRARGRSDPPFFLFWHSYEAHAPYHDERFLGSDGALPPLVAEDAREDWLRYLGDLAALDEAVGRVLAVLDETGLATSTDIIVFSDHGEEFGEHSHGRREDATRHGHGLWDTLLRVPLIIRSPALAPGSRDDLVSLVDLFPTVLDLAGSPAAPSQGRSLRQDSERVAIAAEALYLEHALHEQKCWREASLKHVSVLSLPPTQHVFDLAADPLETSSAHAGADLERLAADAAAFWSQAPLETSVRIGRKPGTEVPPELLESLRSLGYVE